MQPIKISVNMREKRISQIVNEAIKKHRAACPEEANMREYTYAKGTAAGGYEARWCSPLLTCQIVGGTLVLRYAPSDHMGTISACKAGVVPGRKNKKEGK